MGSPGGVRVFTTSFDLFCFLKIRIHLNTEIKDPVEKRKERQSLTPKRSKRYG